jgi:hypothetical protein
MDLLNDHGRLFGVVNVINALSVVVAGVALVFSGGSCKHADIDESSASRPRDPAYA